MTQRMDWGTYKVRVSQKVLPLALLSYVTCYMSKGLLTEFSL